MRLLRHTSLTILCASVSLGVLAADSLPRDVARYIERRDVCEHWRGEDGYDKERQAQINFGQCQSCPGSDAGLAKLKAKYKNNPAVVSRLKNYEVRIEGNAPEEQATFCLGIANERATQK
jgi:hypothetical protein